VGCGEHRAATLLGLDAGMRGPAADRDAQVADALSRRDDVAVRAGAFEDETDVRTRSGFADVPARHDRADLLVRIRDVDESLEGQLAQDVAQRGDRVEPGEQARLHVGDARPVGTAVDDAERAGGGGAGVEDGVEMADQQEPRAGLGPALERRNNGVAQRVVRADVDLCTLAPEEFRRPRADGVDTGLGVAAAVRVDDALEINEELRQRRRDVGLQRVEVTLRDAAARLGEGGHGASLATRGLAILRGPCA
jgi:hypothetical protein